MAKIKAHSARANAGKKTKRQAVLETMTLAYDLEGIARSIFRDPEEAVPLVPSEGIEDKLYGIASRVAIRLPDAPETATIEGLSEETAEKELETSRAWIEAHCNDLQIIDIEKMALANWQVIHGLRAHLAKHLIIAQSLQDRARFLRARAEEDLSKIRPTAAVFVNRLFGAGVEYNNLTNMSRERLTRVVAAIMGTDIASAAEAVAKIPGMDEDEQEALTPTPEDPHIPEDEAGNLPASNDATEERAPSLLKPGSVFDRIARRFEALGVEVSVRRAASPKDHEALKMRRPNGINSLRDFVFDEGTDSYEIRVQRWGDTHNLEELIRLWSNKVGMGLSFDERRFWGVLLAFLQAGDDQAKQFPSYADGLILPGSDIGDLVMEINAKSG